MLLKKYDKDTLSVYARKVFFFTKNSLQAQLAPLRLQAGVTDWSMILAFVIYQVVQMKPSPFSDVTALSGSVTSVPPGIMKKDGNYRTRKSAYSD